VEWIAETLREEGFEVKLFTPNEIVPSGCSLFVVASPVYYERPLRSVLDFVKSCEELKGKKACALIVCTVPRALEGYAKRMYLKPLIKALESSGAHVVKSFLFQGWIVRPPKRARERAREVAKEIAEEGR
jgi:menaquinone-dependent protoporphyrinogen oxidase